MGKGISVFMGMNYSLEENLNLIRTAGKLGIDRVFTSMHIPEADYDEILRGLGKVIEEAKKFNMEIIGDISPKGLKLLGLECMDFAKFKAVGIDVIRLDFGFSSQEIAAYTNNKEGVKIEINASTLRTDTFRELERYEANFDNLQGCHNYYPQKHTALDENLLLEKNRLLKERKVKISAFIPSLVGKRGPLYDGLPTLEDHRYKDPYVSAKHLFALGVDNVFFGDSMPSGIELENFAAVSEDTIELRINKIIDSNLVDRYLNDNIFNNRIDYPRDIIRGENSGTILKGQVVKPENTIGREKGCVTLNNKDYLRYMGELQIVKNPLEADSRVNVIGKIKEEDLFLLKYIKGQTKFKFKVID